jgi:hypothetical protein
MPILKRLTREELARAVKLIEETKKKMEKARLISLPRHVPSTEFKN